MALVDRLMGEPFVPHAQKIRVHEFFAANVEILAGNLTVAGVKTAYGMDAAAIAEYDALVAQTPAQNQTAARAMYLERIHAVFTLAERRFPGYGTPAEVRAKIGL